MVSSAIDEYRTRSSSPLVLVFVPVITTPRRTNSSMVCSADLIREKAEVKVTHKLCARVTVHMCCHRYVTIYVFYPVRASTTVSYLLSGTYIVGGFIYYLL